MTTRLRFTSNPVLVILLGVMMAVGGRFLETSLHTEVYSPEARLLVGLIPELLLITLIARALILLRQLQARLSAAQQSLRDMPPLIASLVHSISADRSNISQLLHASQELTEPCHRGLCDRVMVASANCDHTCSIARRLDRAFEGIRQLLGINRTERFPEAETNARFEPQHLAPASMKLRTLPNGSLDRTQLIEFR